MPRSQMPDDAESEQKDAGGKGCQRDEAYIDHAMNLLAAAAVFTRGEMAFVVAAHFRRQAGNIVAPARQNLANDWINALLTPGVRRIGPRLQPNRLHRLGLRRQKHAVLK